MRHKGQVKQGSQRQRVAELLAEDVETPAIAARLGMTRGAVNARISDIRKDLGWQSA